MDDRWLDGMSVLESALASAADISVSLDLGDFESWSSDGCWSVNYESSATGSDGRS